MIVYIIFFTILIIGTLESFQYKKHSSLYVPLSVLIVVFAALRGNGFDWISYEDIYDNIHKGVVQRGLTFVEYGFVILCKISPSYKFLISIVAIISLTSTFIGTYKFNARYLPVLGLLIFSTTMLMPTFMGQIRQGMAIGFSCIAIYYIYKRKRYKAFIFVLLACLFHISAVLTLCTLFIPHIRLKLRSYIIVICICLMMYTLSMLIFFQLINYITIEPIQKILFYASSENYELGFSSTILIRIFTLLLAVYLNRNNQDNSISFICNVYACGIAVYLLFGFIPQLGGRGALYFVVYEMVLIPFIVYRLHRQKMMFGLSYLLILALSVYRLHAFFANDYNFQSYIPYLQY